MTDQNRWGEDRYSDRDRQEAYRTNTDRVRGPNGQDAGQDRYRDRGYGAEHSGYGDPGYGGDAPFSRGQGYGGASRSYEERAFTGGARGYDPYGSAYGAYGEETSRDRYGQPSRDERPYDNRQASGSMLHQGYRAPFAGVRGDAQGFSGAAYGQADTTRYQYNDDRVERNRDGGGFGARDFAAQGDRGVWDRTRDEVSSWFGDDQAAHRRKLDEARHSLHRGRGPKSYTRSDDRIREDVNDQLTDDPMLDASDIDAKVANGEVTLSGHVESRQAKRRAEDIADRIAGVKHVQNNLRVKDGRASASAPEQTGAGLTPGAQASNKAN